MWGRVVARCYALDDGLLPLKALRNIDLLALDGAMAGTVGKRIDLTNMVDAVVVSTLQRSAGRRSPHIGLVPYKTGGK